MFSSGRNMWEAARRDVLGLGEEVGSRDGHSLEVLAWQGTLEDAKTAWVGGRSRMYAAAELAWYLSGTDEGWIKFYAPSYERFLRDDGRADGAYGHRWAMFNQIDWVIDELMRSPESRRAVMTCWDPSIDISNVTQGTKDAPCTLSLQFLVRNKKLHCIATMRSNDIWYGMPYDIFCFTAVQRLIAYHMGLRVGTYTHQVGSLHIYSRDKHKELKSFSAKDFELWDNVTCPGHVLVDTEQALRHGQPVQPRASGLFHALATSLATS